MLSTIICFRVDWVLMLCLFSMTLTTSLTTMLDTTRKFHATTVKGFENTLVKEIRVLPGVLDIVVGKRGVNFSGTTATGLAALLWLRSSLKVMEVIATSQSIVTSDDIYDLTKSVSWTDMISSEQTIKCDVVFGGSIPSGITHTHYTALTMKNAIIDQFRDRVGSRPSVNINDPDLTLLCYLHKKTATLYRVWSGDQSMHKRGYRSDMTIHKAAMRETTAAALMMLAGCSAHKPLTICDPMCGSGTLLIEAALIQCDTAPGLFRYGTNNDNDLFSREPVPTSWKDVDYILWHDILKEAQARDKRTASTTSKKSIFLGNDINDAALKIARAGAHAAGVDHLISFQQGDAANFKPKKFPDLIVANPPWDRRLDQDADLAWQSLNTFFQRTVQSKEFEQKEASSLKGFVVTGNFDLPRELDYEPDAVVQFDAANVEQEFLRYSL